MLLLGLAAGAAGGVGSFTGAAAEPDLAPTPLNSDPTGIVDPRVPGSSFAGAGIPDLSYLSPDLSLDAT